MPDRCVVPDPCSGFPKSAGLSGFRTGRRCWVLLPRFSSPNQPAATCQPARKRKQVESPRPESQRSQVGGKGEWVRRDGDDPRERSGERLNGADEYFMLVWTMDVQQAEVT